MARNIHPNNTSQESHLLRISQLYVQGWTQDDIANKIGCSQSQVSRDLKRLRDRWAEQSVNNINEYKKRELERLDTLEMTYWNAWEKFKGDGRSQNFKYLDGVNKVIDTRCKILGLNAPNKVAPTDPTGNHEYGSNESLTSRIDSLAAKLRESNSITEDRSD